MAEETGFSLTVHNCTGVEASLIMTVIEFARAEGDYVPGSEEALEFLVESLLSYHGRSLENFITDLPYEPERLEMIANKMAEFSALVKEAISFSDEERRETRRRVREKRDKK